MYIFKFVISKTHFDHGYWFIHYIYIIPYILYITSDYHNNSKKVNDKIFQLISGYVDNFKSHNY